MNKTNFILLILGIALVLTSLSSALTISEVTSNNLVPGGESTIGIRIKNTLNEDVTDVSLNLIFTNQPFISIGSSEDSVDEILEDDTKKFSFKIKASNTIKPGDYQLPYSLSYKLSNDQTIQKSGSIGVSVEGQPDLDFVLLKENEIIGQKGKLTLKIINKGFGNAKFVSVRTSGSGYTLLSTDQEYIGDINSDDFETAVFDVRFNSKTAVFSAIVEYTDFNNRKITKNVDIPFTTYTTQEAIDAGLIKKSNTMFYVLGIIFFLLIWFFYRKWKKAQKLKKSRQSNGGI